MIYGDNVYSETVQTAHILLFYTVYNTLARAQIMIYDLLSKFSKASSACSQLLFSLLVNTNTNEDVKWTISECQCQMCKCGGGFSYPL